METYSQCRSSQQDSYGLNGGDGKMKMMGKHTKSIKPLLSILYKCTKKLPFGLEDILRERPRLSVCGLFGSCGLIHIASLLHFFVLLFTFYIYWISEYQICNLDTSHVSKGIMIVCLKMLPVVIQSDNKL